MTSQNNKIIFNPESYQFFEDYKNIMVDAFGISCSTCGSPFITYVLNDSPTPIGKIIKQTNKNFSDKEIDEIIQIPIKQWQEFDDDNSEKNIPVFLCDECFNTL